MCCWQLLDVGGGFDHFGHQNPLSFYVSVGHTSKFCHQHPKNVLNFIKSPTSLSPDKQHKYNFKNMINNRLGHKSYRYRMHLSRLSEHLLFQRWIRLTTIFPNLHQIRILCPDFARAVMFSRLPLPWLVLNCEFKSSNRDFYLNGLPRVLEQRPVYDHARRKGSKTNYQHWKYHSHFEFESL